MGNNVLTATGGIQFEVKEITPEEAQNLLVKNIKNRPLNERTVNYYAEQMKNGKWQLNGEAIQFSKGGVLLNGQHRLKAVIKAGVPVTFMLVYNVSEEAFTTYDQQRTRTAADIFSIEGIKKATVVSATSAKTLLLYKGTYTARDGAKRRLISKEDILNEYLNHRELYDEMTNHAQVFYRKMNIFSVAEYGSYMIYLMLTRKHDKDHVLGFFRQLAYLESPKFDIITRLRDTLLSAKIKRVKLSEKIRYAYLVKAWNCYHTEKDTKILTFDETKDVLPNFL